jgi:hypothetical protein
MVEIVRILRIRAQTLSISPCLSTYMTQERAAVRMKEPMLLLLPRLERRPAILPRMNCSTLGLIFLETMRTIGYIMVQVVGCRRVLHPQRRTCAFPR